MSYTQQTLASNEQLVYRAVFHWTLFISPFKFVLWSVIWLMLALWVRAIWLFDFRPVLPIDIWQAQPEYIRLLLSNILLGLAFFLVLIGLLRFVLLVVRYHAWEIAATNQRLVFRHGYFRLSTVELLLRSIESVKIRQGFLGRLLNFGYLEVYSTGRTVLRVDKIARPAELWAAIRSHISS